MGTRGPHSPFLEVSKLPSDCHPQPHGATRAASPPGLSPSLCSHVLVALNCSAGCDHESHLRAPLHTPGPAGARAQPRHPSGPNQEGQPPGGTEAAGTRLHLQRYSPWSQTAASILEPGRWLVRRGLGGRGQGRNQPLQPFPVKRTGFGSQDPTCGSRSCGQGSGQLGSSCAGFSELLCLLPDQPRESHNLKLTSSGRVKSCWQLSARRKKDN